MYRNESVIPTEVRLRSYRVHNHEESKNDGAIHLQLDLVDEVRVTAEQRFYGTKTAWRSTIIPRSDTETSRLEISS